MFSRLLLNCQKEKTKDFCVVRGWGALVSKGRIDSNISLCGNAIHVNDIDTKYSLIQLSIELALCRRPGSINEYQAFLGS